MNETKYLDYNGLTAYHNKLLDLIAKDTLVIASALNDLDTRVTTNSTILEDLRKKTLSIDFHENEDTILWQTAYGLALTIKKFIGSNISKVLISYGNTLEAEYNLGNVNIVIDNNLLVTFTVRRTADAQSAVLGVQFMLNEL